jgi:2-furoyl-CoA dehydrogenase 2Fe-2S iron sulfur subunit
MKKYSQQSMHEVTIVLNGQQRRGQCESRTLLSDFVRDSFGATGTHVGCEHGVCGACTVHVEGVAVRACMTLAAQVDGLAVDTVEGLAGSAETMNDLQQAFRRNHALQCGFCTAGILMSCTDYLNRNPDPTEAEVREMLSGHLCRCTGYTNIVNAVLETAANRRQISEPSTTSS